MPDNFLHINIEYNCIRHLLPQSGKAGGQMSHTYGYDNMHHIVSKLGNFTSYNVDSRRIPYADTETDSVTVDYQSKYSRQQQAAINDNADFGVPYT